MRTVLMTLALLSLGCSEKTAARCKSNIGCQPEELCLSGTCEAANGRVVSVSIKAATSTGGEPFRTLVGGTIALSAKVSGVDEQGVIWSAQGGSIDDTGLYTATSAGTWRGPINPSDATVAFEQAQRFSATVINAVDGAVRWIVLESNGGTISADGLLRLSLGRERSQE